MARLARVVIPGVPHHVTQRGNNRGRTFFDDGDYALYLDMLAESSARARTAVWAYCLMPNHVHIILEPSDTDGLRRTFADLHRRYTSFINVRARTTGHLWQGRYGSVTMDEAHLINAVRYVTLNPVRAHLAGVDDNVVRVAPVHERVGDFAQFLAASFDEDAAYAALRRAETIGRPVGDADWLAALEAQTGRRLRPGKRGRKRAQSNGD